VRILVALLAAAAAVLPASAIAAPALQGDRFAISNATADNGIGGSNSQNSAHSAQIASGDGSTLVVWEDHRPFLPGHGPVQIYGQVLDDAGAAQGGDFRISLGTRQTNLPSVAYSPTTHEYLVVWEGERTSNRYEIYGQRVSPAGGPGGAGRPLQTDDIQISDTVGANANNSAFNPSVAFSPDSGEYLVAWADYRLGPTEIFGRRVSGTGATIAGDVRLTNAGDKSADADAGSPQLVYNARDHRWGLFWLDSRDGGRFTAQGNQTLYEVYARLFTADLGTIGIEQRLDAPVAGDELPPIATTASTNRPLDVAVDEEHGVYFAVVASRWDKDGKLIAPNIEGLMWLPDNSVVTTHVSDIQNAPGDNWGYMSAVVPSVAYAPVADEYLVTYVSPEADLDFRKHATLNEDRYELFGQRVGYVRRNDDPCPAGRFEKPCDSYTTTEIEEDFRISFVSDMEANRDGSDGAIAYVPGANRYLAAYDATAVPEPAMANGYTFNDTSGWWEIFGQKIAGPEAKDAPPFAPPAAPPGGTTAPGDTTALPQDAAGDLLGGLLDLLTGSDAAVILVSCPAAQLSTTCDGDLTGETLKAVASAKARKLRFGPSHFSVPRGQTRGVRLKLTAAARKALARTGKLKIRLTVARKGFPAVTRTVTLTGVSDLRVSRTGAVVVKAPRGPVTLRIGKRVAASGVSKAAAGRLAKVTLTLAKRDRAAIAAGRRVKATLVVTGASLAVRLRRG
jgi:hypothetical protein